MSDLENKKTEETPKKRPYNLREKKEKKAAYRSLIRPELADELYDKILNIIVVQKKYKDPDYSAKDLAKELKTNTRYLSAVVNSRFGMNYSCLLNEYRVKDALHLLTDKRYADKNVEEISAMVGFANRQSFYAAFYKNVGETPNGYRKKHLENINNFSICSETECTNQHGYRNLFISIYFNIEHIVGICFIL